MDHISLYNGISIELHRIQGSSLLNRMILTEINGFFHMTLRDNNG